MTRLPLPRTERRVVTVLFADLVGWTGLGESLDPEDLRAVQQDYFVLTRDVVERYGGVVEKYIGDAVMACFGAPVAHENDPYRAVHAALDIRAALEALRRPDGLPMLARFGVSTGEAVVALEGSEDQGLVTGDVTAVAARLQEAAPVGGVLVGPVTHRATVGAFTYAGQEPLSLRGKTDPLEVWLAEAPVARLPDTYAHEPPLVGRETELALLTGALQRASGEPTVQLVTLVGDPGVGKSRLVRGLLEHTDGLPELITVRTGRCLPFGDGVSYWPLTEIVKAQAGVLDTDAADVAADRLRRAVEALVEPAELARVLDAVAPLLGLDSPRPGSAQAAGIDSDRAAWRRLLLAMAAQRPTVLVVEDLHWADDGLLDLLESLVEAAAGLPLLLVATTRPQLLDRRPDWGGGLRDSLTLSLSPLDDRETARLFAGLLGQAVLPADTQARLVALSGGNPLYAQEYVAMLADVGALRRPAPAEPAAEGTSARGAAGPVPAEAGHGLRLGTLAGLPLPDSVQGIISSRLDLLPATDRAVLQAAATVGEVVWPGAVSAAANASRGDVEAALARLDRGEMLRRRRKSSVGGETEYAFRHVLVRDLAYARSPRAVRAEQHERAAEWVERLASGRNEDLAELVVHHRLAALELASAAGLPTGRFTGPAAAALLLAAERAYRLYALPQARTHVRRAIELWDPDNDPAGRWEALRLAEELLFLTDEPTFYTGGGPERLAGIAAALLELGEVTEAACAHTLLGQVEWYRADGAAALHHLERAVELLSGSPPSEQQAAAHAELARLHMLSHHHDEAVRLAGVARRLGEELDLLEIVVNATVTAGVSRYLGGDRRGGTADQEQAVELARTHQLHALHRAANNLAVTLQEEGQLARSYELIEESETVGRAAGLSLTTRFAEPDIALRAYFDADWTRALQVADSFLEPLPGSSPQSWEVHLRVLRAWMRLLRDEPDPGDLPLALTLSRRAGFPQLVRPALAHAGLCALLRNRPQEAAALHDELDAAWRDEPGTASREWLHAAVAVAAELDGRLGGSRLGLVHERLLSVAEPTLWVRAGTASARGGIDAACGRFPEAARAHERAAALYGQIGDASARGLAAVQAGRAWQGAGDTEAALRWRDEAATFVVRTGAVRLLDDDRTRRLRRLGTG